jgi:hypothetical protein
MVVWRAGGPVLPAATPWSTPPRAGAPKAGSRPAAALGAGVSGPDATDPDPLIKSAAWPDWSRPAKHCLPRRIVRRAEGQVLPAASSFPPLPPPEALHAGAPHCSGITMRDGKQHLDCAQLAPSHTGAHHAVYSIGKIVCRVSEPCAGPAAITRPTSRARSESQRPPASGPGTTITVVPQNPKQASEGNTGREAAAHKPPRREPMDAAARLAGSR